MKKRIGVRLPLNVERELSYFKDKYGVSDAYVLLLAYKLSDRKQLEKLLSIRLTEEIQE